jgi:two-component system, NarL family, response regulator LiaR
MIRLLVVDDLAAVRQGLRMRLAFEPDFCVVGEAGDGMSALAQATALQPDVVVMAVEMPERDGIAATGRLRAINPRGRCCRVRVQAPVPRGAALHNPASGLAGCQ